MSDLGNLITAFAALVVPLAIAYLLIGATGRSRLLRRPKAESGKKAAETRQIQE